MARPLTIPLIISPDHLFDDELVIEVDSVVQADRNQPWGPERLRRGFGFGRPDVTPFGVWIILLSLTPFGAGLFGQGAIRLDHVSLADFVAGDYTVRVRADDHLGNQGAWSDPATIEHRPDPPPPRDLAVTANVLTWTWSDPE